MKKVVFFQEMEKNISFPTPFIFECLKMEASAESPVIIISQDKDFKPPVETEKHISLLRTIPELFQKLGLQIEVPEIEEFLDTHEKEMLELVTKELSDWILYDSAIEDSNIEIDEATEVEPIDLISFRSLEQGRKHSDCWHLKNNCERLLHTP